MPPGLDDVFETHDEAALNRIREELVTAREKRIWYVGEALRAGLTQEEVCRLSGIDAWFIEPDRRTGRLGAIHPRQCAVRYRRDAHACAEAAGFRRCAYRCPDWRRGAGSARAPSCTGRAPVYKRVDTCAAEFPSATAYLYSSYDEECEARPSDRRKIMVLGGGPNRIGQGIEFDYCCVHAAQALSEDGFETIMVNCNPETVSTDYDTSERLYFEPLTAEMCWRSSRSSSRKA